jgi:tRNA(Glu) U13 pseudouridine synthase TruD
LKRLKAKAIWSALCAILILAWIPGCLFAPSDRILTPQEEQQLQRQEESTYSLPSTQQGLAQKQVECDRENLEKKDWHAGDHVLDALSDEPSNCSSFYEKATQSKQFDALKKIRLEIDINIDKNLKDALDKSQKKDPFIKTEEKTWQTK